MPGTAAPRGVLVMGGDCGALGAIRSLAPLGVPVRFLPGANGLARFSRLARTVSGWPGPLAPGALERLEDLAGEGAAGFLLMPAGDGEVQLVARHHERLSQLFRLLTPSWDATRHCADKRLITRSAPAWGSAIRSSTTCRGPPRPASRSSSSPP